MDYAKRIERMMGMDDAAWARHSNPWSGWTRIPILPLLALTIWSRVWVGWWCLVPIALLIAWTWLNPRVFAAPKSTDNWMSQAVLGERIWLARKENAIPRHHARAAAVLNLCAVSGLLVLIYGLYVLDIWAATLGTILVVIFKMWFLDRMVWLFRDEENKVL